MGKSGLVEKDPQWKWEEEPHEGGEKPHRGGRERSHGGDRKILRTRWLICIQEKKIFKKKWNIILVVSRETRPPKSTIQNTFVCSKLLELKCWSLYSIILGCSILSSRPA